MQDLHLPQNKKTNRRNVMKRKVCVGMDVHKETIQIAILPSNTKALVKEQQIKHEEIFLIRRSQEGRWQIDRSLNSISHSPWVVR
ncbi:hypothetical protein BWD12_20360 [Leptospira santarosai serovar Bananal]|nr:hypothetical protein BWD12_20360 [Leptospira santarosai serovar Bananal]